MIKDLKVPQAGCGAARGPVRSALAAALIILCSASANALPLTWRADWPDAKPVETLVHRGTDIELQPTWYINGQEANPSNWTFTTYCQTNAVGPWFGPLPGAFFSHTNDVGAAFYNVMVRAQTPGGQVNYTAFARLRMLDSPGFAPGELPLPVPFIDFSKVVALHAPWTLQTDFSAATNTLSASVASLSAATNNLSAAIGGLAQNLETNYYTSAETDDAIDSLAAYYITYTAAGAAFPTRAALLNATVVYSGGVARTPTRNDYAVVLADETHGGAEWRYIYTVAAGATSGQWDAQYPIETNDYVALANKPQINGHTLTNNQSGAALGLANVTDFAGPNPVIVPFRASIAGSAQNATKAVGAGALEVDSSNVRSAQTIFDQIDGKLATTGGTMTANLTIKNTYTTGGLILKEDSSPSSIGVYISATEIGDVNQTWYKVLSELAVQDDISAAISPTAPAFSNAVLSVGLGIDTNTVAVINELVDSAHDLPVSGATSVGALLLALAAAVAALKGNKADKPTNPTNGNLVKVSGTGELQDAGYHFEVRNGIPCIVQYA